MPSTCRTYSIYCTNQQSTKQIANLLGSCIRKASPGSKHILRLACNHNSYLLKSKSGNISSRPNGELLKWFHIKLFFPVTQIIIILHITRKIIKFSILNSFSITILQKKKANNIKIIILANIPREKGNISIISYMVVQMVTLDLFQVSVTQARCGHP